MYAVFYIYISTVTQLKCSARLRSTVKLKWKISRFIHFNQKLSDNSVSSLLLASFLVSNFSSCDPFASILYALNYVQN